MKLLHTSDWHVGKAIRGASRADEHRAVLDEIAAIAAAEDVDLVVVAGDLFDTVDAVAGVRGDRLPGPARPRRHRRHRRRHRRQPRQRPAACAPSPRCSSSATSTSSPSPTRPDDGGVLALTTRDGTDVRVAHAAVRVQAGHRARRRPDGRRGVRERPALQRPAAPADRGAVRGVPRGHGQRPRRPRLRARRRRTAAASDRPTSSTSTPSPRRRSPPTIGYGALGHLHRAQRIPAGPPLHYCGSPLQLDFGEGEQPKQVNVVTLEPGVPADVRPVRLDVGPPAAHRHRHARRARRRSPSTATRGCASSCAGRAGPGWPTTSAQLLGPGVVDVRIDAPAGAGRAAGATTTAAARRSSSTSTCAGEGVDDDRVADAVRRAARRARRRRREAAAASSWRASAPSATRARRRLHRHRARRPRRRHRVGQVDDHRRHHVRPLRQRRPLRRQAGRRPGDQPDEHPGPGAARLRGRRRAATPPCGSSSARREGATTKEARLERGDEVLAADARVDVDRGRAACSASTSTSSTAPSCCPRVASPTSSTTARPTARRRCASCSAWRSTSDDRRARPASGRPPLRNQVDALRPDLDGGRARADRRAPAGARRPTVPASCRTPAGVHRAPRPAGADRRRAGRRSSGGCPRSTRSSPSSPRCGHRDGLAELERRAGRVRRRGPETPARAGRRPGRAGAPPTRPSPRRPTWRRAAPSCSVAGTRPTAVAEHDATTADLAAAEARCERRPDGAADDVATAQAALDAEPRRRRRRRARRAASRGGRSEPGPRRALAGAADASSGTARRRRGDRDGRRPTPRGPSTR